MKTFFEIVAAVLLFGPYVWECINDANGDEDKVKDVYIRVSLAMAVAVIANYLADRNIWAAFFLSLSIHFAFFDYTVNILLSKNLDRTPEQKKWFSYLGEKGVTDNFRPWRNMNHWGRLAIRAGILIATALAYILL